MNKLFLNFLIFLCVPAFSYAQIADSAQVIVGNKPKLKAFIVPTVFIGYGLVSLAGDNFIRRLDYTTNAELREDHPSFVQRIDNQTRYAPFVAVYVLDLVGIKAKHNLVDRSAMLLLSAVLAQGSVSLVKGIKPRMRPNGFNDDSFPSGHTAIAFMSAEFLHQEFKDQSIWYSIGGYTIATGTGILRLYNNAHWVSDVVTGAGLGILSTKLSYWIYPYIKRQFYHGKPVKMAFAPSYQNGNIGFNLIKQF